MDNPFKDVEDMLDRTLEEIPNIKRELLVSVSSKLERGVLSNVRSSVINDSGDFERSIYTKTSDYYAAVRVNHKIAPHAHLVENGHRNISRGPNRKGSLATGISFVAGKHNFRNAYLTLNDELIRDGESAADKIAQIAKEM